MHAVILCESYGIPALRGKLRRLAGVGAEITAIVPARDAVGTVAAFETDGGVRIVPVPTIGGGADPARRAWARRALRRAITPLRPALVQVEDEPSTLLAATAVAVCRRLNVPLVGFSTRPEPPMTWRARRRRRAVVARLAGLHAGSAAAAELVATARPGLPTLIAPQFGVPVPPAAAPPGEFVIGLNGRLLPDRGFDLALQAAAQLAAPWRMVVAGSGPAVEDLEALAERLGISARITWLGALPREERAGVWQSVSCAVAPALAGAAFAEVAGPTVLPPMAAGLPVVASRTGVLPELLDDTGILVTPGDVASLAVALQRLAESAELRATLGRAARERVLARYSVDAVADRTLAFWRQLLTPV